MDLLQKIAYVVSITPAQARKAVRTVFGKQLKNLKNVSNAIKQNTPEVIQVKNRLSNIFPYNNKAFDEFWHNLSDRKRVIGLLEEDIAKHPDIWGNLSKKMHSPEGVKKYLEEQVRNVTRETRLFDRLRKVIPNYPRPNIPESRSLYNPLRDYIYIV